MNFQNRPISKSKTSSKEKSVPTPAPLKSTHTQKAKIFTVVLGVIIILGLTWSIVALVKSLDLSSIIFSAGKNLRVDENGHTNILLTGVGGKGHDGADLTDTIIVASIDYDNKAVAMLSIPRDLYIEDKRFTNGSRINAIYSIGKDKFTSVQRMENLKQIASDISGVSIQYWLKIDFKGFTQIIDSLGGIHIDVEKDIYDATYPKDGTRGYAPFSIAAGPHDLDGETALKYARTRHDGDGDFDRARRQQQLLTAIKEKALSLNILTDPIKIQALYTSVSSNLETDFALTEIVELAQIAKDFGKESIVSHVLTNHATDCGGFLYVPSKNQYQGSVLLPMGDNYNYLQVFTKNFLQNPLLMKDQSPIQVLNGTKTSNVAGKITNVLSRFCFNVVHYGNAENRELKESTLYYKPGPQGEKPPLLNFIPLLLPPMKQQAGIPEAYLDNEKKRDTIFVVELGADYLEKQLIDPSTK